MDFHEVANIFPLMNGRDYQELKADIADNGQREPIVVHDGQIIDGRHRYRACIELGIEPKCKEWDQQGSLLTFALSMNLHRRHLSASQRSMLAAEIKPLFEKEARERQGKRTDLGASLRPSERGKASGHAAKIVNVSSRSVESANKVKRDGVPELTEAVKTGKISVSSAARIADLPPDDQRTIVSLEDKRDSIVQSEHAVQRGNKHRDVHGDDSEVGTDTVESIVELLACTTDILGGKDPKVLARTFFTNFPCNNRHLIRKLEDNIQSAKLFCEIYRQWEDEKLKVV